MKIVYPVIFTETKDEKDLILVDIPDIDGMTEGYGIFDAIEMAKDYIGNILLDKTDDEIPIPSKISDIDATKGYFSDEGSSFVSLVDVDLDYFRRMQRTRTVRRNITLPEWLDSMAARAKINVSAIAQAALKERLGVSMAQ